MTVTDATPMSAEAAERLEAKVDALSAQLADVADTAQVVRHLVDSAPALERTVGALQQLAELVDDLAPLGTDAMTLLTERLAEVDRKGYFAAARAGAGVADRVVTNFGEDDIVQLGENVVTILETVKEITQPEMLVLLGRMVDAVRRQQHLVEIEDSEPPGLWALAKQVRDPDVRRGLSRALGTLRSVSVETGPSAGIPSPTER